MKCSKNNKEMGRRVCNPICPNWGECIEELGYDDSYTQKYWYKDLATPYEIAMKNFLFENGEKIIWRFKKAHK